MLYIPSPMYMVDVETGSVEFAPGSREFDPDVTEQGSFINQFLVCNSKTLELPYSRSRIKATKSSSPTFLQATAYVCQE